MNIQVSLFTESFTNGKYINVAWRFALRSVVRLVHLEMLNIVRTSCINIKPVIIYL